MPYSVKVSKLMRPRGEWPVLDGNLQVRVAIKILRILTEEEKLEHGHSTPLVLGDEGKLLGFVHLTDLLRNVRHLCEKTDAPCELDKATTPIKELVTLFAGSVNPDDSILEALDIMMNHGVSLVPVMKDGKVEGIIKLSDIFNAVAALLFDEQNPLERERLLQRVRW
jgi:predicted transcriptional regulator